MKNLESLSNGERTHINRCLAEARKVHDEKQSWQAMLNAMIVLGSENELLGCLGAGRELHRLRFAQTTGQITWQNFSARLREFSDRYPGEECTSVFSLITRRFRN